VPLQSKDFIAGAELRSSRARTPFVRALPPVTLKLWRVCFEQMRLIPNVRSAGLALLDELERCYRELDPERWRVTSVEPSPMPAETITVELQCKE
jgi:hypothetical protein